MAWRQERERGRRNSKSFDIYFEYFFAKLLLPGTWGCSTYFLWSFITSECVYDSSSHWNGKSYYHIFVAFDISKIGHNSHLVNEGVLVFCYNWMNTLSKWPLWNIWVPPRSELWTPSVESDCFAGTTTTTTLKLTYICLKNCWAWTRSWKRFLA